VLSRTTRAGATISFTYDNLNRATAKTSAAGNVNYDYDLAGRLLSATDPATGNSLPSVATPVSPGVRYTTNYSYDQLGRLCSANWNGVWIACPSTGPAGGTATISASFTYNNLDQRATQTVSDAVFLNTPPGSFGDSTTSTYGTANSLNQIPTVDSATLTYDSNGGVTQ